MEAVCYAFNLWKRCVLKLEDTFNNVNLHTIGNKLILIRNLQSTDIWGDITLLPISGAESKLQTSY